MRSRLCFSFLRAMALLAMVLCSANCRGNHQLPIEGRFTIYVVGDGVPPIRKEINRIFPLNRAQGQAMWRGAETALKTSPRLSAVRHIVALKGFDDGSLAIEARNFATSLKDRKDVIAVIGHATSQTTRAAIGRYSEFGIPIIMPIATSDLVMYPEEAPGKRVVNAFRLPPSDARAQAPAVAYLVKVKNFSKVLIVQDVSEGAKGYSQTLMDAIAPLIRSSTVAIVQVNRSQRQTFSEAAVSARSNDVQAIVFCGYGSTAQDFFYALREQYKGQELSARPTLILTDGCLVADLNPEGFTSFLTFPHLGIEDVSEVAHEEDVRIVKGLNASGSPPSYEPFGYDAMLILGQVMQACLGKKRLSRRCIVEELSHSAQPFFGVTGVYEFDSGENRHSRYDVFRSGLGTGYKFDKANKMTISAEVLSRIRSER
jgi:ABC-type branched-subunit amino acid transport system substrate-binding protein